MDENNKNIIEESKANSILPKYCTNCGKKIKESTKFCNGCGFKVEEYEKLQTLSEYNQNRFKEAVLIESKGTIHKLKLWGIIGLLIIIVVFSTSSVIKWINAVNYLKGIEKSAVDEAVYEKENVDNEEKLNISENQNVDNIEVPEKQELSVSEMSKAFFDELSTNQTRVLFDDEVIKNCEIVLYTVDPSEENNGANYVIEGPEFNGFYDSDCVKVDGNKFYYSYTVGKNSFYYIMDRKDEEVAVYFGSSFDTCNQLVGKFSINSRRTPTGYEVPYVRCDISKLGEQYSTYHKDAPKSKNDGLVLEYGSGSLSILCYNNYFLNRDKRPDSIENDYNGAYSSVGVKNDRIVFSIYEGGNVTLNEVAPEMDDKVEPLTVEIMNENNRSIMQVRLWKANNGYFAYYTSVNDSTWNSTVHYLITTTDLNYIDGIPSEVKNTNGPFDSVKLNSTGYVNNNTEQSMDYVFANSDREYLCEDDLRGLTKEECQIARNEIYARHGRKFLIDEIQQYFNGKSWYKPLIEAEDFKESMLNEYEIKNANFILEYEKKHFK